MGSDPINFVSFFFMGSGPINYMDISSLEMDC